MPGSEGPRKLTSDMTKGELVMLLVVFTVMPLFNLASITIQGLRLGLTPFGIVGAVLSLTVMVLSCRTFVGELRRRRRD
jgi:hypothetical protein